ncbi:MAG: formyltransferase family protein [Candidatus Pacebacteria bacterium]|nr:formyltransferase family protein [Candidatus Paceibacterota bacterium]
MSQNSLKFPAQKSFLIVGSGDPVKTFLRGLAKFFKGSPVFVISDKECDRAWSACEKEPIEKVAKENGFEIEFVQDINDKETIEKIKKRGCNVCFVLGSRWIFKKEFIEIFNGCVFNYHTSDLPAYRGGGGYRWQVMNEEKNIYIAFHQIAVEIDKGSVLAMAKKELRAQKNIYPKDIFNQLYDFTKDYFAEFLEKLSKNDSVILSEQDQAKASYFPLLDNEINGAIDLGWNIKDIKLFIEAFSYPYKGAFIFYKDRKIFIKEAEISSRKEKYHPFATGLIINKGADFLEMAGSGGCILLKEICDERGAKLPVSEFKLGDRLSMPGDELLKARNYRPSNKSFVLKVNNGENGK